MKMSQIKKVERKDLKEDWCLHSPMLSFIPSHYKKIMNLRRTFATEFPSQIMFVTENQLLFRRKMVSNEICDRTCSVGKPWSLINLRRTKFRRKIQ